MEELTGYLNLTDSRLLNAAMLFALFALLAKIVDIVLSRVLKRLARFTKSETDDKIIELLRQPLYFIVLLIGAIESIQYLKPNEKFMFYADGIFYSLIVLILCFALIRLTRERWTPSFGQFWG